MKKFLVTILLILSFSSNALSQDASYTRYRLPKGERITASGVTYQGFQLGDYKLLLSIDADLKAAEEKIPLLEKKSVDLQLNVDRLGEVVRLGTLETVICKKEVGRKDFELTKAVLDKVKLEQELEHRKRVFRITLGVGAALIGGLVLGLSVK